MCPSVADDSMSPPGGAMIQSSAIIKHHKDTAKVFYKRFERKKQRINSCIIKHYVNTSVVLLWKLRWKLIGASLDLLMSHLGSMAKEIMSTQSVQISGQLFPRKLHPKISVRKEWLAAILVYPPSFYTFCCQCLTGSRMSRPGCSRLLSLCKHTRCIGVCH